MTTFRVDYKTDKANVVYQFKHAQAMAGGIAAVTPYPPSEAARGVDGQTLWRREDEIIESVPGVNTPIGPVPPAGTTIRVVPPPVSGYGSSFAGTTPGRSAVPPLTDPNNVPTTAAEIARWMQTRVAEQKHSFRDIRDGFDLLGGTSGYVYTGNSRDRGTFAAYPGV